MHMSFRNRLTFFFILLVILPVLAVGLVGIFVVRDSEEEKTATRLEQAQTAARGVLQEQLARARTVVGTVSKDEELAIAIRDGDRAAIEARLQNLVARSGAVRVRLELEDGQTVETGRGGEAVAPAVGEISDAAGR